MNTSTTITHAQAPPAPIGAELRTSRSLVLPRPLVQGVLIFAMLAGATALWTFVPAICLMLVSGLTDSHALLVLAVFVGIPAAMTIVGRQLARLEALYERVSGRSPVARAVPAWRRSYSEGRPSGRGTVLDAVMVASVLSAAAAWSAWFFVAGASA